MAVAETARLVVDLSLKGNFAKQLSTSGRALGKFDARLDKTESRAFRAGQQIGTGIKRAAAIGAVGVGLLAFQVERGLSSLVELEKQQAQTNAVIKSTGGIAGVTATEVGRLAEKYEGLNATIGDEVIREGENLLLTFTNIRKKGFEPALKAALDLNTRLGKGPEGLTSTVRLVGKALNDPTKGLSALTRVGVQFDQKTIKRIKTLQKQGKLFQAQTVILKELEKRYGGAFAAEGGTTGAKVAKFNDSIEDLQRTLASGLLPVVSNIADALTELFQDPQVQKGVAEFGQNLAKVFSPGAIKSGIATVKDVFSTIAAVAGPAASAVGTMVAAFNKLPPDLRNLLIGAVAVNKLTGGLVGNVAGGLASAIGGALKTIVAGNVTVIGKNVVSPGGLPGAGGKGGGGLAGKAGGLLKGVAGATIVGGVAVTAAQVAGITRSSEGRTINALGNIVRQSAFYKTPVPVTGKFGGMSPDERQEQAALKKRVSELAMQEQRAGERTRVSIDRVKAAQAETKRETTRGVMATQSTKQAVNTSAAIIASSQARAAGAIIGAIYAARPVVNVTNVQKTTTIQNRYGPGNGSRGQDHGGSIGFGGGN